MAIRQPLAFIANMKKYIKNYLSGSGTAADYIVDVIGHDGYIRLLGECKKELEEMLTHDMTPEYHQAATELLASYNKSIEGGSQKAPFQVDEGYEYLFNCKVIECKVKYAPKAKPKTYKNKVTEIKDMLRNSLPIKSYIGCFKLGPDKCDGVFDVPDTFTLSDDSAEVSTAG